MVNVGAEAGVRAEVRAEVAVSALTEVQLELAAVLAVLGLTQDPVTFPVVARNLLHCHTGHEVAVSHRTDLTVMKRMHHPDSDHAVVVYHQIVWRPRIDLY